MRALTGWSGDELFAGRFMTFTVNPDVHAAWLRRSADVVPTTEALDDLAEIERLGKLIAGGVGGWRVLIDTRLAPGRTDGDFEEKILPRILEVTNRYAEVGVLVRTLVGKMQAQRVSREGALHHHVFSSEEDALAFLSGR